MAICLIPLFSSPLHASTNVLFILDASGSMWGQVEGKAKITIAKQVLGALLKDLPPEINVGLMVYGHRTEGDCKDVELLAPIGASNPEKLAARLAPIVAKGKTPLAYSLELTLPYFSSLTGQNNFVILVSDGIETCGGAPDKAAAKLAAANIGVKVHVVGFDVSAAERKYLEAIAQQGKGRYFQAQNAAGLKDAFAQVKMEVAQVKPEPKPEPPKPKFKEYFFDDFQGNKLKEEWEVLNPNPDAITVEGGAVLIINATEGDLAKENIPNMLRLQKPLPPGDWVMTAKVKVDFQTSEEKVFLGLYASKDNYIVVQNTHSSRDGWGYFIPFSVEVVKRARDQVVRFEKELFPRIKLKDKPFAEVMQQLPQPLLLRLSKVGHSYIGGAMLEGAEKPQWVELEKVTSLNPSGNLAIGFYHRYRGYVTGESTVAVDWVKIETPE